MRAAVVAVLSRGRVDRQSMEPRIETVRVAQARQVAPGADECLLDRVARELAVTEDEPGGRVQPRDGRSASTAKAS